MTELLLPFASFAAGAIAGVLFLWSLWRTVCRLKGTRRPVLSLLPGFILRAGLLAAALCAFGLFAGWTQTAAALLGFVTARLLVLHRFAARSDGRAAGA